MEPKNKKFLQFNGKNVYFLSVNGVWYIAIKPICEALGINYNRQFKNIKKDKILGPALAVQPMQVGTDQLRGYASLPEFYVYGWIFSIQSENEELTRFKWKCYELLYNYFHGTLTERTDLLKVKTKAELEIEILEIELSKNETYKKIQELKGKSSDAKKALGKWDKDIVSNQMPLWQTEKTSS